MKKLLIVIGLSIGLLSCTNATPSNTTFQTDPTTVQASQFVTTLDTILQDFSETAARADNSSVEDLPEIIRQLQSIRNNLGSVETPPEAVQTKAALDSYMNSKIQCYFKRLVPDTPQVNQTEKDLCSLTDSKLDYFYKLRDSLK